MSESICLLFDDQFIPEANVQKILPDIRRNFKESEEDIGFLVCLNSANVSHQQCWIVLIGALVFIR